MSKLAAGKSRPQQPEGAAANLGIGDQANLEVN